MDKSQTGKEEKHTIRKKDIQDVRKNSYGIGATRVQSFVAQLILLAKFCKLQFTWDQHQYDKLSCITVRSLIIK